MRRGDRNIQLCGFVVLVNLCAAACGNGPETAATPDPQAPAPAAASTSQGVSEAELQAMRLGEHDEPIVVDNGPTGIALSKTAKPGTNFAFTRHFDQFATLHIIPREANQDPIGAEIATFRLCRTCDVVLVLTPVNNHQGTEERVVFSANPGAHELTMTPYREWWRDPNDKSGRLNPRAAPPLRVNRIEYTPDGSTSPMSYPLTDGMRYRYPNVEILIIGTP